MNYSYETFKIYFTNAEKESINDAVCRFREFSDDFDIVSSIVLDKIRTKGIRKKYLNFNILQIEFLLFLQEYLPEYIYLKIKFRYKRYVKMVETYKNKCL